VLKLGFNTIWEKNMVRERVGLAITKSITVTLNHCVQAQFFGLVVIVVVFFWVPPLEVALIALLYYPVYVFSST